MRTRTRLLLRPVRKLDDRLGFAGVARKSLGKVFPDHWSFMLGEIALYSFVILVLTGVFLTLFFEPTSHLRLYDGSYAPLKGRFVSGAYASSVELSWDVRGGLLMRQAHHWAAHIFIGAIVLHLCRIFFTGMFRKPRELNWVIGLTLLALAIFNAFAGYSLPDDLLSGTGLRIFAAITMSVPVIGAWLTFLVFGREFSADTLIIERFYPLHILIVPAVIALLIAMHLGILIKQKHSHFAGPGRRESNVVGSRVWPAYALRSLALFFAVGAVTFIAGGLLQINPIWVWGDYEPQTILSPSVADWYILWVEGALRQFPRVEVTIGGHLIPEPFWPGALFPALLFLVLYLWPWIDRRLTGDRGTHHVTGQPREAPVRTALGVATLTLLLVLLLSGSEELVVQWTHLPIFTVRNVIRVLIFAAPVAAGLVTYWLTSALKRSDLDAALELGRREIFPISEKGPQNAEAGGDEAPEESPQAVPHEVDEGAAR